VPALLSSALIAFTISFDEFAIASFLVPAGQETYPVYVYAGSRTPALQPQILALGAVVVVASLVLVTLAEVARTRAERRLVL
jgi:spermidine/putrescine transport system permease protein